MLEMKQQHFKNIISNLVNDDMFAVSITDVATGDAIVRNMTGAQMKAEKGSVRNYIDAFAESGYTAISVLPRKKNGSSWRNAGAAVTISSVGNQFTADAFIPTPKPQQDANMFQGLGMPGLGLSEMIKAHEHPKIEAENIFLKAENETLKAKIADFNIEAIKTEFSDKKAKANSEIIQQLTNLAGPLLAGILKGNAPTGLAAPQQQPEISTTQEELINFITRASSGIPEYLKIIINAMNTNTQFGLDLEQLLIKYKLIQQQDEQQ